MLFVASTRHTSGLREALALAVARVVEEVGDQKSAAKRLGIEQSTVSDIVNMRRSLRIETVVAIRNALGISLDELLKLPPVGATEPGVDASLPEVLEYYAGRWDGLPLDLTALASRENPPSGGWKHALDEMAATLREDDAPKSSSSRRPAKRDDLARPRAARDVKAIVTRTIAELDKASSPRAKLLPRG